MLLVGAVLLWCCYLVCWFSLVWSLYAFHAPAMFGAFVLLGACVFPFCMFSLVCDLCGFLFVVAVVAFVCCVRWEYLVRVV